MTFLQRGWIAAALVAATGGALADPPGRDQGVLIRGGLLLDGTGRPGRALDLRTEGVRIAEVGRGLALRKGDSLIEARGLAVVPGFIDLHNHLDQRILVDPDAASQVAQGITTALVGLDGDSALPIGAFLDRVQAARPALNVATLVGHGTLRRAVMGSDFRRAATPAEVAGMARRLDQALQEGAFGLSSGLEYDPGFDATPDEIVTLAAHVARRGGLYATHLREEREEGLAALDEAVDVARRAAVKLQVSHLKLASRATWGHAKDALLLLGPDATADVYPYTYWIGPASVLLPHGADLEAAARDALDEVGGASRLSVVTDPVRSRRDGRTLADIAVAERASGASVLRSLSDSGATLACECMSEADLVTFLRDPRVSIATDGGVAVAHPRGAGTFPRVLARYVREQRALSLEEAIYKMTGAPAERLGLPDRGRLVPGMAADIVVFDPRTVRDRATLLRPHRRPAGIVHVLVGGVAVIAEGRPTGRRPGRALHR